MKKKRIIIILFAFILISSLMAACRSQDSGISPHDRIKVMATLFPLYDFARQIGQDKVDVNLILPPGVEAHSFEPRPADMKRIEGSDCLIFTGYAMEPWMDRLMKGIDSKKLVIIDASKSIILRKRNHDAGDNDRHDKVHPFGHQDGSDPHVWLDFTNAMTMADTIAAGLALKDPVNKAFYMTNAEAYKKQLADLDRKYRQGLSSCHSKVVIHAGHMIFGYLADRYGLTYLSAYGGFAPNAEPTPRRLAELTKRVKKYDVKAIYHEELVKPAMAEALAGETGVPLLMLHGAHNMTKEEIGRGVTFIQLMESNLVNLKRGLQCP